MMLLAMLAAAQPVVDPVGQREIAVDVIASASPSRLAKLLLPRKLATDVRSRTIERSPIPGQPGTVRFYGKSTKLDDGLCHRKAYFVGLTYTRSPPDGGKPKYVAAGSPTVTEQLALSQQCDDQTRFAYVQNGNLAAARVILLELAAQQRQILAREPTRAVACRIEFRGATCGDDPNRTFASLPLDSIFIIEGPNRKLRDWRIAVMPTGPGQPYWDVSVSSDATPPKTAMTWRLPDPF